MCPEDGWLQRRVDNSGIRDRGRFLGPFVRGTRLVAAGNCRFSGARQVPGADVWLRSETSRGLDPDGCLVWQPTRPIPRERKQEASATTHRGGVCQSKRNGKKVVKSCVRWTYCLLTEAFSWVFSLSVAQRRV